MKSFWEGFLKKANQCPSLGKKELNPCSTDSALSYHEKSSGLKRKALLGGAAAMTGLYGAKKLTEDVDDVYHQKRREARLRKLGSFASKIKQTANIFSRMRRRTVKKSVDEAINEIYKHPKFRKSMFAAGTGLFTLPMAGSYIGTKAGQKK